MKKRIPTILATALVTVLVFSLGLTALAASGQITYDGIGVRLFEQQKVAAGERYTAPNGAQVPSSITYTDEKGGTTNYLSIRQISELLDADIGWNAAAGSVDIAPPPTGGFTISDGTGSRPSPLETPEYGKVVGVFEEVDPNTIEALKDSSVHPVLHMKDTRIQYQYYGYPDYTTSITPLNGQYIVYTVTNNGTVNKSVTVYHKVTISEGMPERFPSVLVKPGETLVRAFHMTEDANPLQSTLTFGIGGGFDRENMTDVTVSLEQYH